MKTLLWKTVARAGAVLSAQAALSQGVLIVTSPANGAFVGSTTTISFRIDNGVREVTVRAEITAQVGGGATAIETRVTPDSNGDASGSLTWNPSDAFDEGLYDIHVTATEQGNVYNDVDLTVTLDRKKPELTDHTPQNNSFVNGIVTITAEIEELNLDSWRVTVNNQDIPFNTGNTPTISVTWDTSNIEDDGEQEIKFIIKDLAQNQQEITVSVFLDRQSPTVTVLTPRTDQQIPPLSTLGVAFDVADAAHNSVSISGILVEIRLLDGTLVKRVSRLRYGQVNDTTSRWMGRVRLRLPEGVSNFKLVITVVDKAGNPTVIQEVPLQYSRGRGRGR